MIETMKHMNTELFDKTIRFIETIPPEEFIMSSYYSEEDGPKPARCIAGWCAYLDGMHDPMGYKDGRLLEDNVFKRLNPTGHELLRDKLRTLFYATPLSLNEVQQLPPPARKNAALTVMKKFRTTGIVDWPSAIDKEMPLTL